MSKNKAKLLTTIIVVLYLLVTGYEVACLLSDPNYENRRKTKEEVFQDVIKKSNATVLDVIEIKTSGVSNFCTLTDKGLRTITLKSISYNSWRFSSSTEIGKKLLNDILETDGVYISTVSTQKGLLFFGVFKPGLHVNEVKLLTARNKEYTCEIDNKYPLFAILTREKSVSSITLQGMDAAGKVIVHYQK